MNRFFTELEAHESVLRATVEGHSAVLDGLVAAFLATFRAGHKVMFCGNGGSAADSQHVAAEFVNRFRFDRPPLPALALTVDSSVLTCIGNDDAFEAIFSRQVEALGHAGDLLVGISTSGRSANVLRAFEAARRRGVVTVGLTGANGQATMGPLCDHVLAVPSTDTARIQEVHEFVLHCIAAQVESEMFGGSP